MRRIFSLLPALILPLWFVSAFAQDCVDYTVPGQQGIIDSYPDHRFPIFSGTRGFDLGGYVAYAAICEGGITCSSLCWAKSDTIIPTSISDSELDNARCGYDPGIFCYTVTDTARFRSALDSSVAFELPIESLYAVGAGGGRFYASTQTSKLRIYDLADPLSPVFVSEVDLPGWANRIVAGEDIVAMAILRKVHFLDVSDPSAPVLAGSYDLGELPAFLRIVDGSRLIVAYGGVIHLISFAAPEAPVLLSTFQSEAPFGIIYNDSFAWLDDHLYMAGGDNGLICFDYTDQYNPEVIGTIDQKPIHCVVAGYDCLHAASYEYTKYLTIAPHCSPAVPVGTPGFTAFLAAPVPNPFNPSTRLSFTLDREQTVDLSVYDAQGRLVRTLASGLWRAGETVARWDGRDRSGRPVASGVYFARLTTEDSILTRKMTLMK